MHQLIDAQRRFRRVGEPRVGCFNLDAKIGDYLTGIARYFLTAARLAQLWDSGAEAIA